MNNKLFCFVIPIHPKHYEYMYDFIDKCIFDIWLVFSSESDYDTFIYKNKIKHLIIPNNIVTKNIVVYKKFYALKQLMTMGLPYKYLIVCDSEITPIAKNFNENNIIKKIENTFNDKRFYAGVTTDNVILNVMKTSASVFPIEHHEKLKQMTLNYHLYSWWSEPPVYRMCDLQHFFDIIGDIDLLFEHFDHIIYQYYLVLFHDFKFFNMSNIVPQWWSMESHNLEINDLEKLMLLGYQCCWVPRIAYFTHKLFYDKNGSFLQYHLDRFIVSSSLKKPSIKITNPPKISIDGLQFNFIDGLTDWELKDNIFSFNAIQNISMNDKKIYFIFDIPDFNTIQWVYAFCANIMVLTSCKLFTKYKIIINDQSIYKLMLLEYFGVSPENICTSIEDCNNVCVIPTIENMNNNINVMFDKLPLLLHHDKQIYNVFMAQYGTNSAIDIREIHCDNKITIGCITDTPFSQIFEYVNNSKNVIFTSLGILLLFCPFMYKCNIIFIDNQQITSDSDIVLNKIKLNNTFTIIKHDPLIQDTLNKYFECAK